MFIFEKNFEVKHEMVSVVCDLLLDVVEQLTIEGWQINEEGKERMRNTLDLPNSEVSAKLCQNVASPELIKRYLCRSCPSVITNVQFSGLVQDAVTSYIELSLVRTGAL